MRSRIAIDLIVTAGLMALVTNLISPARGQQMPIEQVVRIYLMQDCGTGDKDPSEWLKKVLSFGDQAIPLLLKAVREGPPSAEQDSLKRLAKNDFKRLQEFVRQGGLRELQDEDVRKDAEKLDENGYVEMRLRSFVRGYQERALNALQALNDPTVINSLREIANQRGLADDLKKEIMKVIEMLQKKP